jgi:hypothetical protein
MLGTLLGGVRIADRIGGVYRVGEICSARLLGENAGTPGKVVSHGARKRLTRVAHSAPPGAQDELSDRFLPVCYPRCGQNSGRERKRTHSECPSNLSSLIVNPKALPPGSQLRKTPRLRHIPVDSRGQD